MFENYGFFFLKQNILNQKMRNVEVDRKNLLNSISVFGLKLERILTLLYKKRKEPQFESINTVYYLYLFFTKILIFSFKNKNLNFFLFKGTKIRKSSRFHWFKQQSICRF